MIAASNNYKNAINASVRNIGAKVEVYQSGTLAATYTKNDAIKSITIERVGEDSKFFGFGVTHKANIKLRDIEREINLSTSNYFKIYIGTKLADETIEYIPFTKLFITEVNRDEKTNELSITAYDTLNKAKSFTVNDLTLETSYTIKDVVNAAAAKIGAINTIMGKNFLPIDNIINPFVSVNKDGTYNIIAGTTSSAVYPTGIEFTLEAGTYTFSCNKTLQTDIILYLQNVTDNSYGIYLTSDTSKPTFTITDNKIMRIMFYIPANKNLVNQNNIGLQVEKGTKATKYEPYIPEFDLEYPNGANFEGTETLQEVLKAAAEVTQTIYFMNDSDELVFKRLDKDGEAIKTISNANYIELDSKTNKRLATICSATEIGDNVSASKMEKSNNTINVYLGDQELCSIGDVKDELIVENRRAKIIKKIGKFVLNGSENWILSLTGVNTNMYYAQYDFTSSIVMSRHFIHNANLYIDDVEGIRFAANNRLWIRSKLKTVNEFKTWLSTNNVTVYYQLATPEEIDFDISGYDLADGVYYGESTQETRSGKNLYNATFEEITSNEVTRYADLQQLYLNGTPTAENRYMFGGTTLPIGTYTLCLELEKGTISDTAFFLYKNGSWTSIASLRLNSSNNFKNYVVFTLEEETTINLAAYLGTTQNCGNAYINYQVVSGQNADYNFEPYGVSPSPEFPSEIVNKETVDAYITYPITGSTQYVRDNPFWELREDIKDLLEAAADTIGGMTINQFECEWRGDLTVEIGDKIALITKDNKTFNSYLLNDSISYNGALEQKTEWQYTDSEETESNPSNLGEALKQTYARVDKANKQIDLIASETDVNRSEISNLQVTTDAINASVQKDINDLTNKVSAAMTAEEVSIAIKNELDNGVSKVETTTGFKFDENGLTISKTGSEMETNVDEDGLSVYRDNEEVLTADNEGVKAYNLHARTYLIIGTSSRFEDYEKDGELRTGCFWIGGAE